MGVAPIGPLQCRVGGGLAGGWGGDIGGNPDWLVEHVSR